MSYDRSMADSLSQRTLVQVDKKCHFSRENPTFVLEGCFDDVFEWWHRLVKCLEANASYGESTAAALEF